jgi:hypothetical protein
MPRGAFLLFARVPAGGISAAKLLNNEKLGTFSPYGQLSGKLSNLASVQRIAFENRAPAAL